MKLLVILITMLTCTIQKNIATLYQTDYKVDIECVEKIESTLHHK